MLVPEAAVRLYLSTPDHHHEEFVGADQRNRRPCGHSRTRQTVPQTVGDVSRERRDNAQAEPFLSSGTQAPG